MADAFRPLTLLLGAVCLWASCVLILALAGLGSRVPEVVAASAPAPLPAVSLTRSVSRLGSLEQYAEVGNRPLLNASRQPVAIAAGDGAAGPAELDVVLTSVLITPRLQLAILTDNKDGSSRRVRVGEMVEGSNWRLVQLEPRRAVIEGPSGPRTLDLRVFDGRSGEMPTPVAGSPNAGVQARSEPAVLTAPPPPRATADVKPDPPAVSQEDQVEAIRKRIEARRAQMRAEADAAAANK